MSKLLIKTDVKNHHQWSNFTIDNLVKLLIDRKIKIRTAESCTGGGIMNSITNIDGSSRIMDLSLLVYSPEIKQKILEVPPELTTEKTIVSKKTSESMNIGLQKYCKSIDLHDVDVYITITGWIGWAPTSDITNTVFFTLGIKNKLNTYCLSVTSGENKTDKKMLIIKRIFLELIFTKLIKFP